MDQLDLALDQLAVSDRNFDRFALMLIDNVIELTLHKFIQEKAGENEMWRKLGKQKHDPKIITRALGQNFDNKAKGACKLGLIDELTCEAILNLHSFRNTAYHKGLRHESILHSLAIYYFTIACEVLKAYKPNHWSWCSNDKISHRVMKYIGNDRFSGGEKAFQAAFSRLSEVALSMGDNIVSDLSSDMKKTIDSTDQDIEFLLSNVEDNRNRDEVVIDTQAWLFAFTDEAKVFAKLHNGPEADSASYINWITENYDWSVKVDPIPSWRTRHNSLVSEKDSSKALKKYCDFMRQTEEIRSNISESAMQLDSYIQLQVDIARGK